MSSFRDAKLRANRDAMRQHLDWLVAPARGTYDDAQIEIAHDTAAQGDFAIRHARLSNLDQISAAIGFAHDCNEAGCNVYVGATLKLPETPRSARTGREHFYVATSAPVDIDKGYDEARQRIRGVGRVELAVFTGSIPATRVHAWFRLAEPCDSAVDYEGAISALAGHVGGDEAACGAGRLMRLGGSVSYPSPEKQARGYQAELTTLRIYRGGQPIDLARLKALAPSRGDLVADQAPDGHRPHGLGLPEQSVGYGEAALRGEAAQVASASKGTRNATLNTAAFRCGQLIADGYLTAEQVRPALFEAAQACGLIADDGDRAARATIESGVVAGIGNPRVRKDSSPITTEPAFEPPPFVELPDSLPRPPGLIGEIVEFIVATSRRPQPGLALMATLGALGAIAGRKYAGPTLSGTHLYICGLAYTGAGKDHAPEVLKTLLHLANLGHLVGPQQFMSETAVYRALNDQPALICFQDEFGGFMTRLAKHSSSGHEVAIKNVYRTAFGRSFGVLSAPAHADLKNKIKPVNSPSLSIYGLSTPEEFYKALTGADLINGFLNRFIVYRTERRCDEVEPSADRFAPPDQILSALRKVAEPARGFAASFAEMDELKPAVRLGWGTGAQAVYDEFARECRSNEKHGEVLSRTAEIAVRIATLQAIGRDPFCKKPVVSVEDMVWARDLMNWAASLMIKDAEAYMAESDNQARAKRVLAVIRDAGRITHSDLLRKLDHQYDTGALKGVLTGLDEAGQIDVLEGQSTPKGGRRGISYLYRG